MSVSFLLTEASSLELLIGVLQGRHIREKPPDFPWGAFPFVSLDGLNHLKSRTHLLVEQQQPKAHGLFKACLTPCKVNSRTGAKAFFSMAAGCLGPAVSILFSFGRVLFFCWEPWGPTVWGPFKLPERKAPKSRPPALAGLGNAGAFLLLASF